MSDSATGHRDANNQQQSNIVGICPEVVVTKEEMGEIIESSEMVGIWMETVTANGLKMTFNRHGTHACLPERLCLERLQLTLPQKWVSSVMTLIAQLLGQGS